MPTNKFQKVVFAFITVVITVHLFVFYNLSYVNQLTMEQLDKYGVPVFGVGLKVWQVVLVEFCFALSLELIVGSPCSMKLAFKIVDPKETKPFMVETMIICCTVFIMCPIMSLIATFLYNDLSWEFMYKDFIFAWLRAIMHNFPLAFFSQLFFIQPLVRKIFGFLFRKQLVTTR